MEQTRASSTVPRRLQASFYFDFDAHPFAHAALFQDGDNGVPVHEALRRLPAYLDHWFSSLRRESSPPSPPQQPLQLDMSSSSSCAVPCCLLARVVLETSAGAHAYGGDTPLGFGDGRPSTTSKGDGEDERRPAVEVVLLLPPDRTMATAHDGSTATNACSTAALQHNVMLRPASVIGRKDGGRLYVGPGCRLMGCHLDLSRGKALLSVPSMDAALVFNFGYTCLDACMFSSQVISTLGQKRLCSLSLRSAGPRSSGRTAPYVPEHAFEKIAFLAIVWSWEARSNRAS